MTKKPCRVALVGCGQIADAHLQEVRKIAGAQLVAVCDRHRDLARQAAARFGVPGVYDDLDALLREARPDVLHVTTPPQTHAAVAKQALAAGVHMYVKKPFDIFVRLVAGVGWSQAVLSDGPSQETAHGSARSPFSH
jgi:predicted dehydrogenase